MNSFFQIHISSLKKRPWKSRLLLLAVVVLLVFAAVMFYLRSPWRGLPYADSFVDGKIEEWTAHGGNWHVVNGAMKNDSNDRGAKLVTGSLHWKSYSVEADLLLLGGGDSGLIFRASDLESGVDSYNGYYAGLRTKDETLVLGRAEHGWIEFPPARMPDGVKPGRWYHLKVSASGCSIRATATEPGTNNSAMVTARDPECFPAGEIGLRSMEAGGMWRNIRVERLSPEDTLALKSAKSPVSTALYPTNQGSIPPASDDRSLPLIERPLPAGVAQPVQSLRLLSVSKPAHAVVRGTVVLTNPLYIQDTSGGAQVDLIAGVPLRIGDAVEVEGDVFPNGLEAGIRNATAYLLSGHAPIPPLSVTADQAATGAYHAMFVEVQGTLYDKSKSQNKLVALELRDGQQTFRAMTNSAAAGAIFKKLDKNSTLLLRGICLTDETYTRNTVPFALLVNSPEDIKMLMGPPWWSPGHLMLLAATMLGLGFIAHLFYSRAEAWRLHAVIHERERLAHEIHDTLAQSFAGIGFELRAIRNRVSKSNVPVESSSLLEELNFACELVRHSHDEARRSIATLQPEATEAGGLIAALEQSARQIVRRSQVKIEASVKGEIRPLPFRVLDSLFRIGHEAIANAIQHGHPSTLLICAAYSQSEITLSIEDNGSGFDPHPNPDGFGLTGMRRRAESINGVLEIETAPQRGTRISVRAPAPPRTYRFWRPAYDGKDSRESRKDAM